MKTHRQGAGAGSTRMDALPARVYQRIKAGFKEDPLRPLKALSVFFVDSAYQGFEKTDTYEKYTAEGQAKIMAEGSKDIPLLNDHVEDVTHKVATIKEGFLITWEEAEALRAGSQEFQTRRVSRIRYHLNLEVDRIVFKGDSKYKIPGLADVTDYIPFVAPDGASNSPLWANKTGFEILEDVRAMHEAGAQSELYMPNVLLLPPTLYKFLVKGISDLNPKTVLQFLEEENLYRMIMRIPELETANDAGTGPAVFSIDANADNMEVGMVVAPAQSGQHRDSADNWQFNFHTRTVGLKVYYSNAITKCENI